MARREIRLEGDPVLRQVARPVGRIDDVIRQLATDLWDTLRQADGSGLAAPQIGVGLRLIVVGIEPAEDRTLVAPLRLTLINPVITASRGDVRDVEGCLSIPGVRGVVPRAERITVEGTDPDGGPVRQELAGWAARIVQHEIDHLDGILYPDRMLPDEPLVPVRPVDRPRRRGAAPRRGRARR